MRRKVVRCIAWAAAFVLFISCFPTQLAVHAAGTGWVERDGITYYLDENGHRAIGWRRIDGNPYYFNENGALASIWGVDVSELDGSIQWTRVRNTGCQFAILRLGFRSYGSTGAIYEDARFDTNIREARAAGIPVGVYFYSQAINTQEAVEEAEFVLEVLSRYPSIEYPVIIDIENTPESGRVTHAELTQREYTDIVLAFGQRIQQSGHRAMVYSYKSILEDRVYAEEFASHHIETWYADYHDIPDAYDGTFTMWQYTDTGYVDGIIGTVDRDVTRVDYAGRYQNLAERGSKDPLPGEVVTSDPVVPEIPQKDFSAYPSLKYGDEGTYVTQLQSWLNKLGYDCGTPDGYYGARTESAVRWFQQDHWIELDGVVGPVTWAEIYELVVQTPDSPIQPINPDQIHDPSSLGDPKDFPDLRIHTRNDFVKLLQERLRELGYDCGTPDGIFGEVTQQQVLAFQKERGLEADGVVGSLTWQALYEEVQEPEEPEEPEEPIEPENPDEVDTSTWPSVSYGSVNSYVTRLQNRLNELGYDCGTADGDFGYNTRNAVIRFQQDHGLVADGVVGQQTWPILYQGAQTPEEPEEPEEPENPGEVDTSTWPSVSYGSVNSYVTKLQTRLNELGYDCGTADGDFGYNTRNAVIRFQQDHGLVADGVVGQQTWPILYQGAQTPEEPEEPEEPENPGEVDTSTWPSVSYGSVNSYVTRLQNRLNELGYDCGTADGDFGYNTRNAVIRFQRDHGLIADGVVGQQTWPILYQGAQTPEEPEEPEEPENPGEVDTSTWPSVSYGSVNSYVTKLQNRLNELGYDCGTADGDFGYNTRNAVIRFQKDHGLVVDGIVGRATWQALYA